MNWKPFNPEALTVGKRISLEIFTDGRGYVVQGEILHKSFYALTLLEDFDDVHYLYPYDDVRRMSFDEIGGKSE